MPMTRRAQQSARLTYAAAFFSLVVLLFSNSLAFCRSIPTNIPRNKLSEADAEDLINKDHNPDWLKSELETYQLTKQIEEMNNQQLTRAGLGPIILRGDETRKEVAFSFDDGPHLAFTPSLIAILVQYHIPATMFLVGTQCQRYPFLVKEEADAGLIIGDHTYHHFSLTRIPKEYIAPEIKGCGDVIYNITGKRPTLFRPPGGDYSPAVARAAGQLGYTTVMWTVDPGDFSKPAAAVILARTLGRIKNGEILLFHDGIPQTMEALPVIIDYLRGHGYKIVSIDQLIQEKKLEHTLSKHADIVMPKE